LEYALSASYTVLSNSVWILAAQWLRTSVLRYDCFDQWCRRRECMRMQVHPQKFWFGENLDKIPENRGKIRGNLGKICKNLRKLPENLNKLPENTRKFASKITWRPLLEVISTTIFMRKHLHKEGPKINSDKFGKIRAKILRIPKGLPAAAPMPST